MPAARSPFSGAEPSAIGADLKGRALSIERFRAGEPERLAAAMVAIDPWKRQGFSAERLVPILSSPFETTAAEPWSIRVGGALAGTIVVRPYWLGGPYLNLLMTLPEYRGAGIGSAALAWFEASARAMGARNGWICVSDFNTGARRLYERHGFQKVAALRGLLIESSDELLLRKRL